MKKVFFPALLITINALASIFCFIEGEPRKGFYWLAAAVLNATVISL